MKKAPEPWTNPEYKKWLSSTLKYVQVSLFLAVICGSISTVVHDQFLNFIFRWIGFASAIIFGISLVTNIIIRLEHSSFLIQNDYTQNRQDVEEVDTEADSEDDDPRERERKALKLKYLQDLGTNTLWHNVPIAGTGHLCSVFSAEKALALIEQAKSEGIVLSLDEICQVIINQIRDLGYAIESLCDEILTESENEENDALLIACAKGLMFALATAQTFDLITKVVATANSENPETTPTDDSDDDDSDDEKYEQKRQP